MLYFLHLLGFVYGCVGFVWVKLTNSGTDVNLPSFFSVFPKFYPDNIFPYGDVGVETEPTAKPYLVCGALVLYCGRYLLTHARR